MYGLTKASGYYLIIQKDDKFGLLTGDAKVIIPVKYERLETMYSNDSYMKFRQNGKWGLVSIITGEEIVPAQYDKEDIKDIDNVDEFWISLLIPFRRFFSSIDFFRKV